VERAPAAPARGVQGSVDERFTIAALAAGATVVRFRQQRAFEPDRPPHAQRDIAVRVEAR
jgi:hypothetical protein